MKILTPNESQLTGAPELITGPLGVLTVQANGEVTVAMRPPTLSEQIAKRIIAEALGVR